MFSRPLASSLACSSPGGFLKPWASMARMKFGEGKKHGREWSELKYSVDDFSLTM